MPLPDFLCIGAQKAGTSWLFAQLRSREDVWMPPVKELQYFSHLFVPEHRAWTKRHIEQGVAQALRQHVTRNARPNLDYVRYLADLGGRDVFTEAWYRAAFDRPAAAGKRVGDVTPEYSTVPEAGIRHIRALLGAVKIIYLIRDPLDRALSQLRMNVSRHADEALDAEGWRRMADAWDIDNRGDYRAYVPRWKAHFAPGDILFLPYGRIASDPAGLLREIEAFLDLPPADYPRLREEVHKGRSIDVPEEIRARLADRMAGQRDFLASEFGRDFAQQT